MKYCQLCITPDTRPHIVLNADNICNACVAHGQRPAVDWVKREKQFKDLVAIIKARKARYDCLIPVSGGKDSTWQVVQCLKYGLHPLAVTWKSPARTKLGEENLANLVSLGVDHVDFQVNPHVEKKFLTQALLRYGAPAIPMHMALFNIPLTLAVKFDIPLIVWGENSATEYGGSEEDRHEFHLNSQWLKRYGVTQGTTAKDWISSELTESEMAPYLGPSDKELEAKKVEAVFLGHFFAWDPETSLHVAEAHGFKVRSEGPKTGYYNYADIDDDFISLHHYLKWYKFGFTRSFDNLSLEIRNGRLTREQAIDFLRNRGDETPEEDIVKFCRFVGMSKDHFFDVIEKFRNPDIWIKKEGRWMIKDFLIPNWTWT